MTVSTAASQTDTSEQWHHALQRQHDLAVGGAAHDADARTGAEAPTTWTTLHKDGPNHLGLRFNSLPDHQMAVITSGCVPFSGRCGAEPRARGLVGFVLGPLAHRGLVAGSRGRQQHCAAVASIRHLPLRSSHPGKDVGACQVSGTTKAPPPSLFLVVATPTHHRMSALPNTCSARGGRACCAGSTARCSQPICLPRAPGAAPPCVTGVQTRGGRTHG